MLHLLWCAHPILYRIEYGVHVHACDASVVNEKAGLFSRQAILLICNPLFLTCTTLPPASTVLCAPKQKRRTSNQLPVFLQGTANRHWLANAVQEGTSTTGVLYLHEGLPIACSYTFCNPRIIDGPYFPRKRLQ